MYNYPITLFDKDCPSDETLGGFFKSNVPPAQIKHLVDFIANLISCTASIQTQISYNTPANMKRSIQIFTGNISSLDFNVKTGDETYKFLYEQGYKAAEKYFNALFSSWINFLKTGARPRKNVWSCFSLLRIQQIMGFGGLYLDLTFLYKAFTLICFLI